MDIKALIFSPLWLLDFAWSTLSPLDLRNYLGSEGVTKELLKLCAGDGEQIRDVALLPGRFGMVGVCYDRACNWVDRSGD